MYLDPDKRVSKGVTSTSLATSIRMPKDLYSMLADLVNPEDPQMRTMARIIIRVLRENLHQYSNEVVAERQARAEEEAARVRQMGMELSEAIRRVTKSAAPAKVKLDLYERIERKVVENRTALKGVKFNPEHRVTMYRRLLDAARNGANEMLKSDPTLVSSIPRDENGERIPAAPIGSRL